MVLTYLIYYKNWQGVKMYCKKTTGYTEHKSRAYGFDHSEVISKCLSLRENTGRDHFTEWNT